MGAGAGIANSSGSSYGTNVDGTARTAQDIINQRNATFAQPFDPSMYSATSQTRGLNANGLPGAVYNSITPQQYHTFMQNYYAANPQASEADARVAGYQAGIFETPSDQGAWNMLLTNVLPAALGYAISGGALNGLVPGLGGAASGAGSAAGAGAHTAGGLAASGVGHATSGVIAPLASGGGALSGALSSVPDIVVTGTRGAAGGAGSGAFGAIGAGAGALPDIEVTGTRPTTPRPEINPGDIVVTANAANAAGGNHTPAGAGAAESLAGGQHATPAPRPITPNINIPWRHLLNMIPRGGGNSGGGAKPATANVSGASPFGGGSGVGVGSEMQGANRPSIYPWVKPGVTSSQQATPNPDEEGRM